MIIENIKVVDLTRTMAKTSLVSTAKTAGVEEDKTQINIVTEIETRPPITTGQIHRKIHTMGIARCILNTIIKA